jgi:protein-S-isoprenylcysteine O-methyltransferase Ste14
MSVCRIRLIYWLILVCTSIVGGIAVDLVLQTKSFLLLLRLLGLVGMILVHFPLKRTGKLLKRLGEAEKWGCTTRLVTIDLYQCVRHPHHLAIGVFMTSLGLAIGYPWSFLIITATQWLWILGFLFLVEERECMEKFGVDYKAYRQQVPMLLPKLKCTFRVLAIPLEVNLANYTGENSGGGNLAQS